jgi:ribosomal protein S12 methylthiotransferase accessory factor
MKRDESMASMVKVYKDRSPEQTIQSAKDILSEVGIFPQEIVWNEFTEHNHSVRIIDLAYLVGTNGKGVSKSYALASAYAEFMERLQNGHLYDRVYGLMPADRFFHPDESEFRTVAMLAEQRPVFNCLVDADEGVLIHTLGETVCGAPFYNLGTGQVVYLPIDLIRITCTSNGMCAGNNPIEAITQGLCEILERFAKKQVFLNDWEAPTIPLSFIERFSVYHLIQELAERRYSVLVKDCTLGGKIPVLGAVIFNRERSQYRLAFGADPIFEIALQRCLTEAVQGTPPDQLAGGFMLDFDLSPAYFADPDARLLELLKTMTDGSGRCPPAFFFSRNEPCFEGAFQAKYRGSRAALQHVSRLIQELGYPIYIRDVSYLNFPAYYVYIPGLSEPSRLDEQALQIAFQELPFIRNCLLNLNSATETDLRRCIASLEAMLNTVNFGCIYQTRYRPTFTKNLCRVSFQDSADFYALQNGYLLALMCHRVGDYERAFRHLGSFLGDTNVREKLPNLPYGMCILAYFKLKSQGIEPDALRDSLAEVFSVEVVDVVLSDLRDRRDSFKGLKLPACGYCLLCPAIQQCNYGRWKEITVRLKDIMQANPIDQGRLGNLSRYT